MDPSLIAQCINTAHAANAQHEFDTALWWCRQALQLAPGLPEAWFNLGIALGGKGQRGEAMQALEKAQSLTLDSSDAQNSIGFQFIELDAYPQAEQCLERSIALAPTYAFPYVNLGKLRAKQKRRDDAVTYFRRAIELQPDLAPAYVNIGGVLNEQNKRTEAEVACRKAIELDSNSSDAWSNLGIVLLSQKRHEAAEMASRKAIALNPRSFEAWSNQGSALFGLKRFQDAANCFRKSLELNPAAVYLEGFVLYTRLLCCDWGNFTDDLYKLTLKIQQGQKVVVPFPVLALTTSLDLQRKAAENFVAYQFAENKLLGPIHQRQRDDNKIRIGYFSADFRDHPVSNLMVEIFELHDRNRFELIGFSFGPANNDEVRKRLAAAFDQFVDVHDKSDTEVAVLSRELGVDIAVDLGGHTEDARTGVFALRAAPVQVSYLGYLGTMGAPYFDYLIADKCTVPEEYRPYYAEKVAYIPSYQANDSKRRIADKVFTREELGLPDAGFVFCCFNNNFKITPHTFDGWMRILQRVEGSTLLLYADNPSAVDNLKREARLRGIDASRLVFAERIERSLYLARYRVADLFLDTFPYNAGTTASDALWAGLPVLTCMGESFASRVAASLLQAIELPELITSSQADYENLAIELAKNPERLQLLKQKLNKNRLTTPLFDSPMVTEKLESAYVAMHERSLAGMPPEHIFVG